MEGDRCLFTASIPDNHDSLSLNGGHVDVMSGFIDSEFDVFTFGERFAVDFFDARRHYQRGRAAVGIRIHVQRQPACRRLSNPPDVDHSVMATITDTCDACDVEQKWTVEHNLRNADCNACGTRHIISLSEQEAFEHEKKSETERQEMFDKLRKWDEEEVGV